MMLNVCKMKGLQKTKQNRTEQNNFHHTPHLFDCSRPVLDLCHIATLHAHRAVLRGKSRT